MHQTMIRLYEIARLRGVIGASNLGRALHESPQTIKNWETRGMSNAGLLAAQTAFKCNASWLQTGEGPKSIENYDAEKLQFMNKLDEMTPDGKKMLLAIMDTYKK